MPQALVSVIVPVYNAHRYLDACLESLTGQSYREIEIILVNDGSRDNSLELCETWAKRDPRIRVLSQKNAGPGAARNLGMASAGGEYLYFVDSDDAVMPEGLAKLAAAMEGGQDLAIGLFEICPDGMTVSLRGRIRENVRLGRADFLERLSRWPGAYYYSAMWNKLYRRDIVQRHGIAFRTDVIWGEDCLFNMEYDRHVHSAVCINEAVYRYNRKVTGLSWNSFFELHKGVRIKKMIYQALKKIYTEEGLYRKYYWRIQRYIFNITLMD